MLPKPSGKYGYTTNDLAEILRDKNIPIKWFWDVFGVNTAAVDDKGRTNYYVYDVEKALYKLKDKDGKSYQWD